MGVGHLAVAVILKKVEPKINLGFLVFAAFLADFLLGILVLLGAEQIHIPLNFNELHYLTFSFPYSHGLTATILWSLAAYLLASIGFKNKRAGLIMGVAVFSHFILDLIVHIPELPLTDNDSVKFGLGLWNYMEIVLGLELAIVAVALVLYLRFIPRLSRSNRIGVAMLLVFTAIMTIMGQLVSNQAPPPALVAVSWIGETVLLSLATMVLDWKQPSSKTHWDV